MSHVLQAVRDWGPVVGALTYCVLVVINITIMRWNITVRLNMQALIREAEERLLLLADTEGLLRQAIEKDREFVCRVCDLLEASRPDSFQDFPVFPGEESPSCGTDTDREGER